MYSFLTKKSNFEYVPVEQESHLKDITAPCKNCIDQKILRTRHILLWLATVLSLIVAAVVMDSSSRAISSLGTFQSGFETDFAPLRSAIEVLEVRFSSNLKFDKDGELYRTVNPEEPPYVGPPSDEIDHAWEEITQQQVFWVAEDEGKQIGGGIYRQPENGMYLAAIEFKHGLHCLNKLRMALDPDYYIPKESPKTHRIHLDHCVDALRELIQCGGDLTPIPIVWSDEVGRQIPDTAQLHTCRNFNFLKDLVYARNRSDFRSN